MFDSLQRSVQIKKSRTTDKGFDRALEILNAARDIFAREGYANLSMRAVAARLGITLGAVQHYYKTKDALLEAMLLHTSDNYHSAIDRIVASMPKASRIGRFKAVTRFFIEDVKTP